jgi:hypothetical protein
MAMNHRDTETQLGRDTSSSCVSVVNYLRIVTRVKPAEALDGIGKFVMLWRRTGDEWRVARVISYGFRAP